ncbi:helix-turn-helix domain-containing protein [Oscillochloris sp. ZM17-4]|uniref:helix-turn-helix domain-containing protein n=1 Tax=Oscillochloris sp. ZM17-4 TaxID=2866714 RepID=UPI001C738B70|nr:helix-turn-helix transcriptional regulator [Oscillochloris sp. ZM17-4]MBX0328839.1 helix-turn-helix domain-containing protein [Oscillochloris sp. ZM17-4]
MSEPSPIDAQVGTALRTARLSRGLRQDDLAVQLGVDRSTIARYENGTRSMSVSTIIQAASLLGRPVTIFLPGVYASDGLQVVLSVLERRPDLLPRVLDLLRVSLQDDAAGE